MAVKGKVVTHQRFILLPPRGITTASISGAAHVTPFMVTLQEGKVTLAGTGKHQVRVIDSIHENGAKLVEMTPAAMLALRTQEPGLRIVPEVFYERARAPRPQLLAKAKTKAGAAPAAAAIKFVVAGTGAAVAGASVVAFTDYANGIGAQGVTRMDGTVKLKLGLGTKIERLYVYPIDTCWALLKKSVQLPLVKPITLRPIDLAVPDILQHFRASAPGSDGADVTVGIVDTGCGPHPGLVIAGGLNTVVGENPASFNDNGDQHGTHVAGIVGARGALKGFAPNATLRAYRVFPKDQGASNYSIVKSIDAAVTDGCDIINLSLGSQGPPDPATSSAIADARAAGAVVIIATGNDGLNSVCQPGADPRAVAVGAFGRKGLYPADCPSAATVGKKSTKDMLNFMADFSNFGPEVGLVGPGVAVVSTVPGNSYAVMDGTSMATPAVSGMIARLLSANASVRNMPRNQARSDAILSMAFNAAKSLGFGPEYEGHGWIS